MRKAALLIVCACLLRSDAFAQERGIELQAVAGYVFDSGEGPSVPAATFGAIGWITRGWGMGVRLSEGLRVDRYDRSIESALGAVVGDGDLRMWSLISQWRWFAGATELNAAVGAGGHGYRVLVNGERLVGSRRGSGFIALELMAGRRLRGPLHVKGGFTYGLAGDLHPFQPVVLLAFVPR